MSTRSAGFYVRWFRDIDGRDVAALAAAGAAIRPLVEDAPWPRELEHEVRAASATLSAPGAADVAVAVRSSAPAEDLLEASFAGQQETYLGVRGADAVVRAARGRKIGICGQAPSDYPEFARFLVQHGIDSISLNPDAIVRGFETIAAAERAMADRPPAPAAAAWSRSAAAS